MRSSLLVVETRNSSLSNSPTKLSFSSPYERASSNSAKLSIVNSSIKKVKQFLENNRKRYTKDIENNNNSTKPMSPSLISINFLKTQDPFYKKYLQSGDQELLECSIHILKKPLNHRLLSEVQILRRYTENLEFFKKLIQKHGQEYHHRCCSALKYQFFSKDSQVIEYGSMGKYFFIIMQGSVGIMTPMIPTTERRKNSFDNLKLFDKAFVYKDLSSKKKEIDSTKLKNIDENKEEVENSMNEIAVLFSGETFGEYSLISNQPAQASIKCKEDCHFAILEKKDFNSILRESEQINLAINCEFFLKMSIFKNFSEFQIKNFFINFREKHCKKNVVIFEENQPAEEIYFIREGEFMIYKNYELSTNKPNNNLEEKIANFCFTRKKGILKLNILTKGDFVGFEDIFMTRKRTFNLKCNSLEGGKLYSIRKDIFIRKMKEDIKVYENLLRETSEKIHRIEERYNFGLEINKIKLGLFQKEERNKKIILPKINLGSLKKCNGIVNESNSFRVLGEKIYESHKRNNNSNSVHFSKNISLFTNQNSLPLKKNNNTNNFSFGIKSNAILENKKTNNLRSIREMEEKIKKLEQYKYEKSNEFSEEFKSEQKLLSQFPWIKQKRSISLINNLEEYLEMQNSTKQYINKLEMDLNISKSYEKD